MPLAVEIPAPVTIRMDREARSHSTRRPASRFALRRTRESDMRVPVLLLAPEPSCMYNSCMHDVGRKRRGAFVALLHTAGVVEAHAELKLSAIGLSLPKLAALTALRDAGESMPLTQLAEQLSCVKSNITQLVDRLEADGLVTR